MNMQEGNGGIGFYFMFLVKTYLKTNTNKKYTDELGIGQKVKNNSVLIAMSLNIQLEIKQ